MKTTGGGVVVVVGGAEQRGYEEGDKQIKEARKRYILLVDAEGLVLKAKVHSAKVFDRGEIKMLLEILGGAKELCSRA